MDISLSTFELSDLFAQVQRNFGSEVQHKNLTLSSSVGDNVPTFILGDYFRIRQVRSNCVRLMHP